MAQDPPVPALGFAVAEELDKPVTFTDTAQTKTKADVRYPTVAPGAAGWPVVIVVHDLGASRRAMIDACKRYTRLGYLTVAYDVRGQGDARTLSPAVGAT